MALILLQVLVLGVIAATADDVDIRWSSGSRVLLPCEVGGSSILQLRGPPPTLTAEDGSRPQPYVWRRNQKEIDPQRILPNGTLVVFSSPDNDSEGEYQCAALHHGGFVLGFPFYLKFAHMDDQFTVHPQHATARTGQPILFFCEIGSQPSANITWLKNGEELSDDSRFRLLSNQLLITELLKEDTGLYRCKARNEYLDKSLVSHDGSLVVEELYEDLEPSLLPIPHESNLIVARGSRVVLPCVVTGWPRPKLVWKLKPPGGRLAELEDTQELLVLQTIELDQEGVYTCFPEGYPQINRTFNVTITDPPTIIYPPLPRAVPRAGTARFNCTALGRPPPTVTWYKDGRPLNMQGKVKVLLSAEGNLKQLVIGEVTSEDAGIYQCFAVNAASSTSSWARLNVTGENAAAPPEVACRPRGPRSVLVSWTPPPNDKVVAYTVHVTPLSEPGTSQTGQPFTGNHTEGIISVDNYLDRYLFQVRSYSAVRKNSASDMTEGVICQGQGVPMKILKRRDDSLLVSWKDFVEELEKTTGGDERKRVAEWMLQYRTNVGEEHNITLRGNVTEHILASSLRAKQVRLLGSKTAEWVSQDLSLVPWTPTSSAGWVPDKGDESSVPEILEVTKVKSHSFLVKWQRKAGDLQSVRVCAWKVQGNHKKCQDSNETSVMLGGLEPGTDYDVQVRVPGNSLDGKLSAMYHVTTAPEDPIILKELKYEFVNESTILVSWKNAPARRRVQHSNNLTEPVEHWRAIEIRQNFVYITGIKPNETTYVLVSGIDPPGSSPVLTVPPHIKEIEAKDLQYEHKENGTVKVSWKQSGPKVVQFTQDFDQPMEKWSVLNVTDTFVTLQGLDKNQKTYVVVTAAGLDRIRNNLVLVVYPEHRFLYMGLGIGGALLLLVLIFFVAIFFWRRRKMSRSPVRSRRRNVSTNEGSETEASEMKSTGRVANGGRDQGEPLLNGHVHITENPTQSKTPNGKMKKGRHYEAAFDVSRSGDHDTTIDTVLDSDTSGTFYNLLDTSRRPEYESRSSRDNSFNKLPDDNMNSEITSTEFERDSSKVQPTLQPNG